MEMPLTDQRMDPILNPHLHATPGTAIAFRIDPASVDRFYGQMLLSHTNIINHMF